MVVRELLTHGAGAAVEALSHPRKTAGQAVGLAQDAVGVGVGAARRVTAGAVGRIAGVAENVAPGRVHDRDFDQAVTDAGAPDATTDAGFTTGEAPEAEVSGTVTRDPDEVAAEAVAREAAAEDEEPAPVSEGGYAVEEDTAEVRTPSGIPAADAGSNPDTDETDLHQPETEPLMDPSTVKAAAAEAKQMRKAASRNKG